MEKTAWGDKETQYFYSLTPDVILNAVEDFGIPCTGRILQLNSLENRVYEIEKELDENLTLKSPSERFVIVKFYRPGRWSEQQILDEHAFLKDLKDQEVPVAAPLLSREGKTLVQVQGVNIWFALFEKAGGRNPDELSTTDIEIVGRLLARMHAVGREKPASHRIKLTPQTYGYDNLATLLDSKVIPANLESQYEVAAKKALDVITPLFEGCKYQRIHGDCHLGNLLSIGESFYWVDFDDMVMGPPVQDVWLILPGRDEYSVRQRMLLLDAYEQMLDFDYGSLKLIEPLRTLRFIHFSAWISKRWQDPCFQTAFVDFGTQRYWQEQIKDLGDQIHHIGQFRPQPNFNS